MADTDVEILFARNRDSVFRYLCRVVGQADAAHDLTQEVFLRLARTKPPEAGPPELRAWVFAIARNLARNHLRDRSRRPELVELIESSTSATQELAHVLREAIASLPALEREIFLLRESIGLSYDEIAASCELTPDAVRSRLHRARQQLRQALGTSPAGERASGVKLTLPG